MKKLLPRFYVNPFTVLYLAIALIIGRFYYVFLFLIIALIHELSHCLGAFCLKIKVYEIEMLPFGFFAKIEDLESYPPFKQILMLVLGPLSFVISIAIFKALYLTNAISIYGYNHAFEAALNILIFNLLPIYPLDGNRILNALFSFVFEESKVRIISILISVVTSIIVIIFLFRNEQIIIAFFLLFNSIKYVFNSYKNYYNFLLVRLFDTTKRKFKISKKYRLFRHYDNYCISEKNIVNEKTIIAYKIKQLKSNQRIIKFWG